MTKPEDIFSTSFFKPKFHHAAYPTEPSSIFTIYPIQGLPTLIQTIKEKPTSKSIRYLLDCSGNIWFSEGGRSNEFIPMHFQMTGELSNHSSCIAAGYLELSSNHQEITMINHDSGFRASLDSIKWPLIVLVTLLPQINMSLASDLRIEELSPNGAPLDLHVLDSADIQAWIQEQFESQLEGFSEQPDEIKIIFYSRPTRGFFSSLDEKATNDASTSATYGITP
jgi:hypothetical protein